MYSAFPVHRRLFQLVYGRPPCVDIVGNFGHEALFLTGKSPTAVTCPATWTATTRFTQPATDNEPSVNGVSVTLKTVPGGMTA